MRRDNRFIEIVHVMPRRVRFRLEWLSEDREEARRVAEELAKERGVVEVRVRPRTGSVLCQHDGHVDASGLAAALRTITGVEQLIGPEQPRPSTVEIARVGSGSTVGRATSELFGDLDRRVAAATEGRLDLATLTTIGFFGFGALEVLLSRRLPAPPWFNLAWWGLRIFASETKALERQIPSVGNASIP